MKKSILSIGILFLMLTSSMPVLALERPGCLANPIDINLSGMSAEADFRAAIADYANYYNIKASRYELCFNFIGDPLNKPEPTSSIVVSSTSAGKDRAGDLYIYGVGSNGIILGAATIDPIFYIQNFIGGKVIIQNMKIEDAANGIKVSDAKVELKNINIEGAPGGNCIELNGANNSVIQGSTISGCTIGIYVLNSTNTLIGGLAGITDKNEITNNAKGILVEGSTGYKHGYNLIHSNALLDDDFIYAVEIVGYPAPDPEQFEAITENVDGKIYAIDCKTDPENPKMSFNRSGGTVQLYIAGLEAKQALKYFMTCDLTGVDEHVFSSLPQGYDYNEENCAIVDQNNDIIEVTGFHTSDHSSELMPSVKLDGLPPVIFADSEGVSMPSVPAQDETAAEGVDIESVSGATGEGVAREVDLLSGSGAGGMGMKCSLTMPNEINSTYATDLGIWWIIFSIGLLGSLRYTKVLARRRKK